jgi:hypothetical protein
MEKWAIDAINRHNAFMEAAYHLVCLANGECSNTQSDLIEIELSNYKVLPNGKMKKTRQKDGNA